jgi:hypothetical protein
VIHVIEIEIDLIDPDDYFYIFVQPPCDAAILEFGVFIFSVFYVASIFLNLVSLPLIIITNLAFSWYFSIISLQTLIMYEMKFVSQYIYILYQFSMPNSCTGHSGLL